MSELGRMVDEIDRDSDADVATSEIVADLAAGTTPIRYVPSSNHSGGVYHRDSLLGKFTAWSALTLHKVRNLLGQILTQSARAA